MESSEDDDDHQPTSEKLVASVSVDGDGDGDDEQGSSHQVVTPIKCYECNFCKRGFSNAQALGGHMNMHRKDKAKLKQQSANSSNLIVTPQQQPPLDIVHRHYDPNLPYWNASHHSQSREGNLVIHTSQKQFPLFAESTEGRETQPPEGTRAVPSPEIDLELRLGNEPQHDSSTGTRKFF